jgi:hypothetical protein
MFLSWVLLGIVLIFLVTMYVGYTSLYKNEENLFMNYHVVYFGEQILYSVGQNSSETLLEYHVDL